MVQRRCLQCRHETDSHCQQPCLESIRWPLRPPRQRLNQPPKNPMHPPNTVTLTPSPLGENGNAFSRSPTATAPQTGCLHAEGRHGSGPSHGVQTPDQTWWCRRREGGSRTSAVEVPRGGQGAAQIPRTSRWRNPVASPMGRWCSPERPRAASAPGRLPDGAPLPGADETARGGGGLDGTYFFGTCADGRRIRLDPISGKTKAPPGSRGQNGHKFQILESGDDLVVKRPSRSARIRLAPAENPKGFSAARSNTRWVGRADSGSSSGSGQFARLAGAPANALFRFPRREGWRPSRV